MNKSLLSAVGAFIYCRTTNRFLFLLRDGPKFKSTWGLAGGKVEKDESLHDALEREIKEEISIDISLNKAIPIEQFTSSDKNFIFHTYLVIVENEFTPVLNFEHRGYCWVNLEDHPRPLHPGVWRTIKFKEVTAKILTVVGQL